VEISTGGFGCVGSSTRRHFGRSIREARQTFARFQTADPQRRRRSNGRRAARRNAAIMETLGHLRAQLTELQAHVTEGKPNAFQPAQTSATDAARSSVVERPPLPESLEKYNFVLENTCKNATTLQDVSR
jgi:enterochelin esterase-like enzyme